MPCAKQELEFTHPPPLQQSNRDQHIISHLSSTLKVHVLYPDQYRRAITFSGIVEDRLGYNHIQEQAVLGRPWILWRYRRYAAGVERRRIEDSLPGQVEGNVLVGDRGPCWSCLRTDTVRQTLLDYLTIDRWWLRWPPAVLSSWRSGIADVAKVVEVSRRVVQRSLVKLVAKVNNRKRAI